VPRRVPSEIQIDLPRRPSSATKRTLEPIGVNRDGSLPRGPGKISLTRLVPALVPSDTHNSRPPWLSAVKKTRLPTGVKSWMALLSGPRRMSRTSPVPLVVPSEIQSSRPCSPSSPTKKTTRVRADEDCASASFLHHGTRRINSVSATVKMAKVELPLVATEVRLIGAITVPDLHSRRACGPRPHTLRPATKEASERTFTPNRTAFPLC
jgi:hypothetical protein